MKWQRSIGLLLAGLGVVAAALWYTSQSPETAPGPVPGKTGTNAVAAARPAAKMPAGTNVARPQSTPGTTAPLRTNVGSTAGTNAPEAATTSTNILSTVKSRFQTLKTHPAFYPVAAAIPLIIGLVFIALSSRGKKSKDSPAQPLTTGIASTRPRKRARAAHIHHCNVLGRGTDRRCLWQFGMRGGGRVSLSREQPAPPGESLPPALVQKGWRSLWQPKLNIAWLPPEQVFLRVLNLPQADFEETLQMVELQLEKISPLPVAQVAWSIQVFPNSPEQQQTVIVLVVARGVVEEFLGQLETDGYLADRLELPLLDQLLATEPKENGVWIYPNAADGSGLALAAWFYDGVLRNVDLLTTTPENRAEALREQLLQTAWAGELEGWVTSRPTWHLVADPPVQNDWEKALREALEQEVEVVPPLQQSELAAATAARAAHADPRFGLVPIEYTTRYQQQTVDRLWMRALGAVVVLYMIGVGIYMVAVQVATFRTQSVEDEVAALGPTYTNAIQLKAQLQVLKDRQELKFAALDCWRAVAELLPESLQLEGFSFGDGRRLVLQGTAPMGQVQQIYQFDGALRKVVVNGQPLFDQLKGESPSYQTAAGGSALNWNFTLELRRSEVQ